MATAKQNEVLENIKKRSFERFEAYMDTMTGREIIAEITSGQENDTVPFSVMLGLYKTVFGDDYEKVKTIFNDSASKVDKLFLEVMESPNVKK